MTENTRDKLTTTLAPLLTLAPASAFGAEGKAPGLPQLDIATWPSQIFWLVILFGAGYLVMAKVVTPRIGSVLEERRNAVESDLERGSEPLRCKGTQI